jgi:hypothetical protein
MAFFMESIAARLIAQPPWPPVALIAQQAVSVFVALVDDVDEAGLVSIRAIAPLAESADDCCFDRHPVTIDVADTAIIAHAVTLRMLTSISPSIAHWRSQPMGQEVRHADQRRWSGRLRALPRLRSLNRRQRCAVHRS